MHVFKLLTLFTVLVVLKASAETNIVPIGVRAFVYQHINAEVQGHYGPNGIESGYNVNETLGINVVTAAIPEASSVVDRLEKSDPELIKSLDLGTLDIKPDIRVSVDVFGMAFGVSKDFMLVGAVPVYKASTRMAGSFNETGSLQKAATRLEDLANQPNSGESREQMVALAQILRQLQAPSGSNVQAVLVNDLGYKPVGNWEGSGIGDIIFYGQVRTINDSIYKQGFKLGAEAPTGKTDDPDNLVDIPFGKGHFVTFAESLNDFYVLGDKWILAMNGKFAYQWGHTATYRLIPEGDLPLTSEKEQLYRKPGNIGILNAHSEIKLFSDLYFHSDYIYTNKSKDEYRGSRNHYDYGILERNTNQVSYVGEVGFSFSTANLYVKNQFPIPFKLGMFMSRVLGGENVDRVDMASLRFEMYF